MAFKSHPTTIRLSEQEQTFLASLKLPGATTASDKIRALIQEKQRQMQAGGDFVTALDTAEGILGPAQQNLKISENQAGMHSQLLRRTLDWAPELLATLLYALPADSKQTAPTLIKLEADIARHVMRLLDEVLQSYIARDSALYRADSLDTDTVKPLGRLCQVVHNDINHKE
ncbi:hypothetical protein [Gilvimarinus algae]|uniref:Uncharacterized protein n=1 Tax=Gilvimarinus algae TaxID=3058037 RepID=A0ABT8THU9_9GAMM|nr:hypothetical protein [Gilvimarinus sp. SDUM040014]MDO3383658.1 hypothetical protein [Gilvimarinus sp. SDUM040014]